MLGQTEDADATCEEWSNHWCLFQSLLDRTFLRKVEGDNLGFCSEKNRSIFVWVSGCMNTWKYNMETHMFGIILACNRVCWIRINLLDQEKSILNYQQPFSQFALQTLQNMQPTPHVFVNYIGFNPIHT